MAGFTLLLFLAAVLAGVGLWRIQAANSTTEQLIEVSLRDERVIAQWDKHIALNALRTIARSKAQDAATIEYFDKGMAETNRIITELLQRLTEELVAPEAVELLGKAWLSRY